MPPGNLGDRPYRACEQTLKRCQVMKVAMKVIADSARSY